MLVYVKRFFNNNVWDRKNFFLLTTVELDLSFLKNFLARLEKNIQNFAFLCKNI